MLTPAATRSVACELSSRMHLRWTAFSSTLPNERSPSLCVLCQATRLVRGRTPPMQLGVLWEEIMARYRQVEVVGEPVRVKSSSVKGFAELQVRLHPW
jgi:hypothetical protein